MYELTHLISKKLKSQPCLGEGPQPLYLSRCEMVRRLRWTGSVTKGDFAEVRGFKKKSKEKSDTDSSEQNSEMTQLKVVEEDDTWPSGTSWQHTNPWRSECSIVHNRHIRHIGPPIISSRQHASACLNTNSR